MAAITSAMKRVLQKAVSAKSDTIDLENVSEENVTFLKKTQLKEALKALGLPRSGNVTDLRNRLLHYLRRKKAEGEEDETPCPGNVVGVDYKQSKNSPTSDQAREAGVSGKVSGRAKIGSTSAAFSDIRGNGRKKWGFTDPAHIAPNCYHSDLFAANFPLVKVVHVLPGHPFPVRDKFEGNVLDAKATAEARKRWFKRYIEVDQMYCTAENEQQAFARHFAFMESLFKFTLPTREDFQIHDEKCVRLKRKWCYEEVQAERKRRKVDAGGEENAGLRIVPDNEEVQGPLGPNRSDGDDEGMEVAPEEVAQLTGSLKGSVDAVSGFADGVLHVTDYRPLQHGVCETTCDFNPDRVVAVLERKFAEDHHKWDARFQGGFYAVKHCLVNLQRGHGGPVYVLVMTSSLWSYGILVPEGFVQIRDGKIDAKCMPQFKSHQAMTGVSQADLEALQERLEVGTEFYRRNYRENPCADYGDGPMLVGSYYLSRRWFSLPRPVHGDGNLEDVRRFFDGLMRLVLGDSVIDMKAEDFEWRWQLRECMVEEVAAVWSWYES